MWHGQRNTSQGVRSILFDQGNRERIGPRGGSGNRERAWWRAKLYSEPGLGTSIKVLFPSTREIPAPIDASEPRGSYWRGEGTILVVDDQETVRSVATQIFERAGFDVVTAVDGINALEMYEKHKKAVKVVLLDMTMPRLGGADTFREMRRIRKNVPTILSSGYNEQTAINQFSGKGLAGFIQKPYRFDQLLEIVRRVIAE